MLLYGSVNVHEINTNVTILRKNKRCHLSALLLIIIPYEDWVFQTLSMNGVILRITDRSFENTNEKSTFSGTFIQSMTFVICTFAKATDFTMCSFEIPPTLEEAISGKDDIPCLLF